MNILFYHTEDWGDWEGHRLMTHHHVQETSLRQSMLSFDMKHHIAGRSHQKMDTLITSAQKCARKKPSSHIPHTSYTTRSPNCWDKAGWIHDFMSFMWNSDRTIHRKTSRLIRPRNVFPNCSANLFFLFTVEECSSGDLGCNKECRFLFFVLTELVPSFLLEAVCSFSSDLNKALSCWELLLFAPFFVKLSSF